MQALQDTPAIPAVNFGAATGFAVGIEEELLLVDPVSHALDHQAVAVLERVSVPRFSGGVFPETYSSLVELASGVCAHAEDAAHQLAGLRTRIAAAGATTIGSGLHPDGAFG